MYTIKTWVRDSVSEKINQDIQEKISSFTERNKKDFETLAQQARDFVFNNPECDLGNRKEYVTIFTTVTIEKRETISVAIVTFKPAIYGDGRTSEYFKSEIPFVFQLKENVVFLPSPSWVTSSCECGYAGHSGRFEYESDAKVSTLEFIKTLTNLF